MPPGMAEEHTAADEYAMVTIFTSGTSAAASTVLSGSNNDY